MLVVRRIGAVLLVAAAVAVWFLMAPEVPETPRNEAQEQVRNRESDIERALSDSELNEAIADSAPQQQVVNGWVARDLLEIIATQQNDALARDEIAPVVTPVVPPDERTPALVGLLVAGLALALATTPRAAEKADRFASAPSGTPGPEPWAAQVPS